MKTAKDTYRIKADFNYYAGTFYAPKNVYLMSEPEYDSRTGREYQTPLEFDSVGDAFDHLTSHHDGYTHGTGCEYDGDGHFSVGGTYVTAHGQHSRPVYTVVSRRSGRCNQQIVAACDKLHAAN
jgi:hypothetical protein